MQAADNLICQPAIRKARQQEKHHLVLRFLRQHLWTSQLILQLVLGLTSRQAAHKTLKQMAVLGLIKSCIFKALGGNLTLWGITHQGQAIAFNVDTECLVDSCFEPSRISEQTIRHQLDIHLLRLQAEAAGWTNWLDGDRLGAYGKDQKRPDALAKDSKGSIVAFECERTFKSTKRYEQILVNYLKLIKSQNIAYVVWVCPSKEMTIRLKIILTSIKSVRVNGQRIEIDPMKHHLNLFFSSYDIWPLFNVSTIPE